MAKRPEPAIQGRVHLIDDDPAVGKCIMRLSEGGGLEVRAYASAENFLAAYDGHRPGCILLDLMLPGMTGVEALSRFVRQGVRLPVIMLSGQGDVPTAVRCMRLGAVDFFQKPLDRQALFDSVWEALQADAERIEPDRANEVAARRLAALSRREKEILQLVIDGHSSKDIGHLLGISDKTVDVHRSNMMRKAGARSVAELVRLAVTCQAPR